MVQRSIDCANCDGKNFKDFVKALGNRGIDFIAPWHQVVICENCGLVFINPQHDDQDYNRFYQAFNYKKERKALSKKEILDKHAFKKIPLKFLIDFMQMAQILKNRPRVLDVGCGFGMVIHFMREFGLEAEGLEQSADAVEFAQNQLGLKIHAGSILDHGLPENNYDVVLSTAVMEHFTDPLLALNQMRKLLMPDGILFVNTPDLKGIVLREGIDRYFKFVHTYYYTNVTLSSLIQRAGFEILLTWQMPPILKHSTIFHPSNAYSGKLNIIARKKDYDPPPPPLKDDVDEVIHIFQEARKRDSVYRRMNVLRKKKILGYPLRYIRKNLIKRQYLFCDYFDGEDVTDNFQSI